MIRKIKHNDDKRCELCGEASKFLVGCPLCDKEKRKYCHPSCLVQIKKDRNDKRRTKFKFVESGHILCLAHKDIPLPPEITKGSNPDVLLLNESTSPTNSKTEHSLS